MDFQCLRSGCTREGVFKIEVMSSAVHGRTVSTTTVSCDDSKCRAERKTTSLRTFGEIWKVAEYQMELNETEL